jgi:putative transposase
VRYDARTYTLTLRAAKGHVSLAFAAERLKESFAIDPHTQDILDQTIASIAPICSTARAGSGCTSSSHALMDVGFRPSGKVVGMDTGVSHPADCSNNRFFGERR